MSRLSMMERPHAGTKFITLNARKCEACWKCYNACPQKVFGRINIIIHKHVVIRNADACTGCRKCVKACAYGAIK